jgi:hypothetical protein
MRTLRPFLLATAITLGFSTAQAGGVLKGLEMDVMEPGETSAQAISRIALPKAGNLGDENPDYAGVLSEQALVGGGDARDAMAGEIGNGAAESPSPGDGPTAGIDVGEPVPGGDDAIVIDDGGIVEPAPGDDTIVIDDVIEGPVEDSREGTPGEAVEPGEVSILPLESPPMDGAAGIEN